MELAHEEAKHSGDPCIALPSHLHAERSVTGAICGNDN